MEKQEIVFTRYQDKKHSVRYQAQQVHLGRAISDIYVSKTYLGPNPPEKLKLTLEEADDS